LLIKYKNIPIKHTQNTLDTITLSFNSWTNHS